MAENVRIVQEIERTGAAVSEIARRHVARSSMLTRRRTLGAGVGDEPDRRGRFESQRWRSMPLARSKCTS